MQSGLFIAAALLLQCDCSSLLSCEIANISSEATVSPSIRSNPLMLLFTADSLAYATILLFILCTTLTNNHHDAALVHGNAKVLQKDTFFGTQNRHSYLNPNMSENPSYWMHPPWQLCNWSSSSYTRSDLRLWMFQQTCFNLEGRDSVFRPGWTSVCTTKLNLQLSTVAQHQQTNVQCTGQ